MKTQSQAGALSLALFFISGCKLRNSASVARDAVASNLSSGQIHESYVDACGSSTMIVSNDTASRSSLDSTGDGNSAIALTDQLGNTNDIAVRAKDVFSSCARCHTPLDSLDASARDLLENAMDISELKQKSQQILSAVKKKRMPPEHSPDFLTAGLTDEQIATVQAWYTAGSPDFNTVAASSSGRPVDFITTADVMSCIASDLNKLDTRQRQFTRYITLTDLYNAEVPDSTLGDYRLGLAKLLNSLSKNPLIKLPLAVDPAAVILRIDLDAYKWTKETWLRIASRSPYNVTLSDPVATGVYGAVQDQVPLVRGDWFVNAASIPPLYHEILAIPTNLADLISSLQVNLKQNLQRGIAVRAGFINSGVSANNRVIERHEIQTHKGAFWRSYDFGSNTDAKNIVKLPLGPKGIFTSDNLAFAQDGGEVIFGLPNGLQAYMLLNSTDARINEGPIHIVRDKRGVSPVITNGRSCMRCHFEGIISSNNLFTDVEQRIRNADYFDPSVKSLLTSLYDSAKLNDLIGADKARFKISLGETGGKITSEGAETVYRLAESFDEPLNLKQAAAEVGLNPNDFTVKLKSVPDLASTLGSLLDGGVVKRDTFATAFPSVVTKFEIATPFVACDGGDFVSGHCWYISDRTDKTSDNLRTCKAVCGKRNEVPDQVANSKICRTLSSKYEFNPKANKVFTNDSNFCVMTFNYQYETTFFNACSCKFVLDAQPPKS